ncbi:Ig-like domain-containing protein, partial [Psychromonas arctica]|uniref:Ig-like domain-containing protein n=1 Tax=Psychromonas arctica TaxID=168275 RepID=UPI002FD0B7AB
PMLTGNVEDTTATVVVTVDGIEYAATNNADGSWTLADNTLPALDDGETTITVTATDAAGNDATNTGTINVDTVGINVSVDALVTNDTSPALSGSIDDATATVIVTVNGIEYDATNNGNGTWTLADNELAALTEGEIAVSVVATDAANNSSEAATGTITLDLTAPTVTVTSITTSDTTPALNGTVNDNDATVVVTVNSIEYDATNNGNGTWTLADNELATLTEGEIAVSVVATDAANNSSDAATGTITVDLTAPAVAVTSITTNDTTPLLTGTVEDNEATVIVTVNGIEYEATNNADGTWTLADNELAALSEGEIAVSVVATDAANNSSDAATGTITVDLTAPTVAVTSITTNDTTPL